MCAPQPGVEGRHGQVDLSAQPEVEGGGGEVTGSGFRLMRFHGIHTQVMGEYGVEIVKRVVVLPEKLGRQLPCFFDEIAASVAGFRWVGVGREMNERRRALGGGPSLGVCERPHLV